MLDADAVATNIRIIRAAAQAPVMAVVKADGFGCDAVLMAETALAGGATSLGTASIEEALALRDAGLDAPVLSWLHAVDADWEGALRGGVDLGISGTAHLAALADTARRLGAVARVHLHADTGMARDGAAPEDWPALVRAAAAAGDAVEVVGVMGHVACADEPDDPSNAEAVAVFRRAVDAAREAGLRPSVLHLAATEAALRLPDVGFDLVRIGGGLPGIGPGLVGAARLEAPVVLTRRAPVGTLVGYGHESRIGRETVLATVPLGYADGIPRQAFPGAEVLLAGRRRPLVGRVSMDQVVVDAGPDGVPLGATAVFFGSGADGEPTVAEWAAWAGTAERHILTGIGGRVARTAA